MVLERQSEHESQWAAIGSIAKKIGCTSETLREWVLRTNTELSAVEIALRYKQLWMVEQIFRTAKSLLDTRPIFHKTDATICGHVFCSFLALVLREELFRRMHHQGVSAEWDDVLRDLNALTETTITYNGKSFAVRSNAVGVAGKIAQCLGVRLPNTVRQIDVETQSGVDPNSWTPDPLGRRYPPCRDQDRRTRRSSGARWLSWCEPDGVRKSCHESLSRPPR